MERTQFEKLVADVRIVPVVVIKELQDTIPTLSALRDGGIPIAEITFRTACAKDAIALGAKTFPDVAVGAGTVLNATQAKEAIAAGACFIVSPGLSEDVARICNEANVPYFPGCVTPTEIMRALDFGITTVKYFPCNVYGGISAIKSFAGPFPQVKFLPTGGITKETLKEYLDVPNIAAVGGSFMMKGDIVSACKEVMEIVK